MEQLHSNHDEITEYHIDSRVRGEFWLVLVLCVVLTLVLRYAAPVVVEKETVLTPAIVQALGWCEPAPEGK